jgi:3-oxoacyl-[acyl-carrier-protein] synthase-1
MEKEEGEVLLQRLRPLLDTFLRDVPVHFLQEGHAGGLLAIEAAIRLLQDGRAETCIICCVDSHLDLRTLEWLSATRRLKSADNPVGLIPGEGASAFVIEMARTARRHGGELLASLEALGVAEEPLGYFEEGFVPRGEALSAALLQAVRTDRAQALDAGILLADLNGQTQRAMDWGHALVRCVGAEPSFQRMDVWLLAASFGDVGSATGAFLVCYAVRAFARRYSRGREILLFSCSDPGQRAALTLRAPE